MFYVLLALRSELRARGVFDAADAAQARRAAAAGGARHRGRRGEARRQQPPPGRAGPAPHPRRRACRPASPRCSRPRARNAAARHHLRLRLRARPAHQRRRPAGRHDAGHRMPAHRRRRRAPTNWRACSTASTASGATSRAACASRRCCWPRRCSTTAQAPPAAISVFDAGLPRRRGRHRRLAHQGPLPPPDLRLRGQRRRRQGARAQGLGPLDRRAFICAMRSTWWPSGTRACCCASAATRWRPAAPWPRSTSRPSSRRCAQVAHGVARRRHADAPAATPTARWRPSTCASTWSTRCTARSGARASRRRSSARRSR